MRNIKFRFIYGIDGEQDTYFSQSFVFVEIEEGLHIAVIPEGYSILEKQQFTGLKDKDDVDIYDTDFISDGERSGVVKWSEKYLGWSYDGEHLADFTDERFYDLEIIGNIYENPELLKGE